MFASPASTTVRTSNGSTSSWSELSEPRRVLRLADRPRPEAGARAVAHGVVERRADDRDVHAARAQLGRVGDPRQLPERRQADVGRQVEVGVRSRTRGPSRCAPRSRRHPGSWGRSATMVLRRRRRRSAAGHRGRVPPQSGAPPVRVRRPAGRARAIVPGQPGGWRSAPRNSATPPRRAPDPAAARSPSGRRGSPRAASSGRRAGRAAASRNSIEWPGVGSSEIERSGWIVGHDPATRWPCRSSPTSGPCPGPRRRRPPRSRPSARRASRLWFIVVAPPENSTSTVDVRGAARRPRTARGTARFIDLVVAPGRRCGS